MGAQAPCAFWVSMHVQLKLGAYELLQFVKTCAVLYCVYVGSRRGSRTSCPDCPKLDNVSGINWLGENQVSKKDQDDTELSFSGINHDNGKNGGLVRHLIILY